MRRAAGIGVVAFGILLGLILGSVFFSAPPPPLPTEPVAEPAPVVEEAAPEPVAPPPPPLTDADVILDLFNPSAETADAQRTQSRVTQQLEEALTVSFVLRKCERITQQEYSDTYRALIFYAQRMNMAPTLAESEALMQNIGNASSASYALIYSRTPCDAPELAHVTRQLAQWRAQLLSN